MISPLPFPTPLHEQAAQTASDFFAFYVEVDTVLIVNSVARGKGVPESDLDLAVLLKPAVTASDSEKLEDAWKQFAATHLTLQQFEQQSRFAKIHLDFFDGTFIPAVWDDGGGPDAFELEIGNRIAYGVPLHKKSSYYEDLKTKWLPYYEEGLQQRRLIMVRDACAYDLEHVPHFVSRNLHFQAFDRLYKAFQEFLQALFISRQKYPVAYNKWLKEQVAQWLDLPQLYKELPAVLSLHQLESNELCKKADLLNRLLEEWIGY